MSTAPPSGPTIPHLALVCFVVWLIAVASADALGLWIAVGGVGMVLGAVALVFDRASSREMLRPKLVFIALGAAVGGVMAAGTYALYRLLSMVAPFAARDTAHLYSAFRAPSSTIAAVALTPIILGEELVWRNVVQSALTRRFGVWQGAILAAMAYALVLIPLRSPVMLMAALGCGLVWSGLRACTKSLVPALVAHLVWDAIVLIWLPLDG